MPPASSSHQAPSSSSNKWWESCFWKWYDKHWAWAAEHGWQYFDDQGVPVQWDAGRWGGRGVEDDVAMERDGMEKTEDELQRDKLWDFEVEVRIRNTGLTSKECDQLGSLGLFKDGGSELGKKLLKNFGKPVVKAKVKDMFRDLINEGHYVPGMQCPIVSREFILAKHFFLACCTEVRGDGDDDEEPAVRGWCNCFPSTALQLHGCKHKGTPMFMVNYMPNSLCMDCSKCLRCNKWLGIDGGGFVVWLTVMGFFSCLLTVTQ